MEWLILLVIIVILVLMLGGGYFAYTKYVKKDSAAPTEPVGSTLEITEDGASVTEKYMMMPKRERYLQTPDIVRCQGENQAEFCSHWNQEGFAVVYDLSLANTDVMGEAYRECPGGGHDCWYTEKFDNDGTLIAITNKQGESLLDKLADDLWSGKIDMNHQMFNGFGDMVVFKDGKLVSPKSQTVPTGRRVEADEQIKPSDIPGSMYFIFLLIAMKLAGEEKPGRIVLNIKGAKEGFNTFLANARAPRPPSESPPAQ